jgi:hypothetical protein
MKHFNEIDLIELHYLGDEAVEMRAHVEVCDECAARFRGIASTLTESATAQRDELPEFFWARQKQAILRRVAAERCSWWRKPVARFSVAAGFALVITAGWLLVASRQTVPLTPVPAVVTQTASASVEPALIDPAAASDYDSSADPWASDELAPLRDVVAWESWVVQNGDTGGTL